MEKLKGLVVIGLLFGTPLIGSLLLGAFNTLNGSAQWIILGIGVVIVFIMLRKMEKENS